MNTILSVYLPYKMWIEKFQKGSDASDSVKWEFSLTVYIGSSPSPSK